MKTILTTVALATTLGALAAPAAGQSLSDRIAEIRRQETRAQQMPRRTLSLQGRILQALLYTKMTVSFDETPARDVFKYVRTTLDVNVIVRYLDDAAGHGIDPDAPITLEMEDAPALEVLELILEQCATLEPCTWQLRKSFLEIGTKERLSAPAARQLKTYPIDELLFTAPSFTGAPDMRLDGDYLWYWRDGLYNNNGGFSGRYYPGGTGWPGSGGYGGSFGPGGTRGSGHAPTKAEKAEDIVSMIVGAVEPEAWRRNGGDWASIHYRDGTLIVNAPDYIHRQIGGYPPIPPPAPSVPDEPAPASSPAASGGG